MTPMSYDPEKWDGHQVRHLDVVPEEAILTQAGSRRSDGAFSFDEEPKWRTTSGDRFVECDLSMLEGRHSVDAVWRRIRRMTAPARQRRKDAARYFRAGDLHSNNYYALRTPTRNIPEHASVYGDMAAIEALGSGRVPPMVDEQAHRTWWTTTPRVRLELLELERTGNDTDE